MIRRSKQPWPWNELLEAVIAARSELLEATGFEPVSEEEARQKALSHLAPFFAQGVHSGTPERTGDVAENHGTGELVAQYPHTVKCQGDILLDTHRWSGELFKNFYLKEWETTLTKRLGDGDYDLELRFRRRL